MYAVDTNEELCPFGPQHSFLQNDALELFSILNFQQLYKETLNEYEGKLSSTAQMVTNNNAILDDAAS